MVISRNVIIFGLTSIKSEPFDQDM